MDEDRERAGGPRGAAGETGEERRAEPTESKGPPSTPADPGSQEEGPVDGPGRGDDDAGLGATSADRPGRD